MSDKDVTAWIEAIGRAVRKQRDSKGFNQEGVADAAGLSRKTLSNLENGSHSATMDTFVRALIASEVDLWKLFGGRMSLAPKAGIQRHAVIALARDILESGDAALIENTKDILKRLAASSRGSSIPGE